MRDTAILVGLTSILLGIGPCWLLPGGELSGEVETDLPADWSFVDELGSDCALETRPGDAHSITVTCYSAAGTLYVGAMQAPRKRWPKYVIEEPEVRYRAGETIYEMRAVLVETEDERRSAYRARRRLSGDDLPPDVEVPEDYWIFRLEPRTG